MNKKKQILIVDDEADIRELLELTLGRMNLETRSAANIEHARQMLKEFHIDLCLTDMRLPDGNGIDLVQYIQTNHPDVPVAIITGHGNMETAITALKAGAFDFVTKPLDLNDLRNIVRVALRVKKPVATNASAGGQVLNGTSKQLLGQSAAMEAVRAMINKLARSQAPVYISGESGTGKELAAKLIHELSPRSERPFVPVNCGAIPEQLMESEFFGHKKGSFTGAVQDKEGLFHSANGGTLFLDEVGDLPIPMQVKLLRAIQEKTVRPVGGQSEIRVDVRILSATHKNLHELVREGKFRQDLYYRLNVIELSVPSLRGRLEDIRLLAETFCAQLAAKQNMSAPKLSEESIQALMEYRFPGNIRELENILERALTLCDGTEITPDDLHLNDTFTTQGTSETETGVPQRQQNETLDDYIARVEREVIEEALQQTNQNKTAAAKMLGITFRALRYKLEKLGID